MTRGSRHVGDVVRAHRKAGGRQDAKIGLLVHSGVVGWVVFRCRKLTDLLVGDVVRKMLGAGMGGGRVSLSPGLWVDLAVGSGEGSGTWVLTLELDLFVFPLLSDLGSHLGIGS